MAVAATMQWNHDPAGRVTNGGGFNPAQDAVNGVDYSLGARAPAATNTDLSCTDQDGDGGYTVTSAAGGFGADNSIVNSYLTISTTGTGAHFVVGTYLVSGWTSDTQIALSTNPTDGNSGVAGTWRCGGYKAFGDLASVAGSKVLTSAIGGFTHAMEGNTIYLASATAHGCTEVGTAAGRFEIVTYTDTNTVTVDRIVDDGTAMAGGVGYVGGAMLIVNGTNLSVFWNSTNVSPPGSTNYFKNGTYTLTTAAVSVANDGTAVLPIHLVGYYATKGDSCTGSNRPTLATGSYGMTFDNYWGLFNFIITGTASIVMGFDAAGQMVNCAVFNTSATADRSAYEMQSTGSSQDLVNCEFSSPKGKGCSVLSAVNIERCYIHDCKTGINRTNYDGGTILECIIAGCSSYGMLGTSAVWGHVSRCTFYDCATGASATVASNNAWFDNCIFSDCGTEAINWSAIALTNVGDYNNFHNNGGSNSTTNFAQTNKTTADPAFQGEHTWTDLASTATTKVVTSGAGGLDTYYSSTPVPGKSMLVHITGGTHFTAGYYQLDPATAVTSGSMTLLADPTSGGNGSVGTALVCLDFRLGTSSPCLSAGLGISLGVGAASTVDQGAWEQAAGAAAGGGSPYEPVFGLEEMN